MLRFVDSNVFLHAYLKPRRQLSPKEQIIKKQATDIVSRLRDGEEALTSACHLAEVVNILESGRGLGESLGFLSWALSGKNFKVVEVGRDEYEGSLPVAQDSEVSANDALAYVLMMREGVTEIYSFDKHFDKLQEIKRLP